MGNTKMSLFYKKFLEKVKSYRNTLRVLSQIDNRVVTTEWYAKCTFQKERMDKLEVYIKRRAKANKL